jgi:hypothetical protein
MSNPPRDTHPSAHRVQIELIRQASPARRFALAASLTRFTVEASRSALRYRYPDEDERSIAIRWVALHYGPDLAAGVAQRLDPEGE